MLPTAATHAAGPGRSALWQQASRSSWRHREGRSSPRTRASLRPRRRRPCSPPDPNSRDCPALAVRGHQASIADPDRRCRVDDRDAPTRRKGVVPLKHIAPARLPLAGREPSIRTRRSPDREGTPVDCKCMDGTRPRHRPDSPMIFGSVGTGTCLPDPSRIATCSGRHSWRHSSPRSTDRDATTDVIPNASSTVVGGPKWAAAISSASWRGSLRRSPTDRRRGRGRRARRSRHGRERSTA